MQSVGSHTAVLGKTLTILVSLLVSIALAFLPFQAEAGLKKKAAMVAVSYAAKKMIQNGVGSALKKKAAAKFWSTLDKHPDLATKAAEHLMDQARKNPKLKQQYMNLARRVAKRYPELRSIHGSSYAQRINGRLPLNSEYAGRVFPASRLPIGIRKKYPAGVPFTQKGLPDFTRYATHKVQITPQTSRPADFAKANRAAGLKSTPKGYTWHHTEKSGELLLVPSDIHKAVSHTGGIAVGK